MMTHSITKPSVTLPKTLTKSLQRDQNFYAQMLSSITKNQKLKMFMLFLKTREKKFLGLQRRTSYTGLLLMELKKKIK
jgi:hypothetical protein